MIAKPLFVGLFIALLMEGYALHVFVSVTLGLGLMILAINQHVTGLGVSSGMVIIPFGVIIFQLFLWLATSDLVCFMHQ